MSCDITHCPPKPMSCRRFAPAASDTLVKWLRAASLGALFAIAGCQSPPEMDVERQWVDAARRLNMFGFYPMSEDVQIGDIYLHAPPSGGPSLPRFSLLRMAVHEKEDLREELLGQQDRHRLRIAPLPVGKPAEGATPVRELTTAVTKSTNCDGFDIGHADEEGCRLRLQRAAVPALTVGRITNAQLGASGIYGNFGARLGLGSSSETAVSIALRNVQELSLDAWRVSRLEHAHGAELLKLLRAEEVLFYLSQLRPDLLADACNGRTQRLAQQNVEVAVITRVVYAGGIEYSFTRNAETAFRAALDLQSTLPGQPRAPEIPTLSTLPSGTPPTPSADAKLNSAQRLAALLQSVTGEAGTGSRAGVSTSFGIGTFGSLSLKQDFNRPIAVGAGARVRYMLHDVLAGWPFMHVANSALAKERYGYAREHCAGVIGANFDARGLAAAMHVSDAMAP